MRSFHVGIIDLPPATKRHFIYISSHRFIYRLSLRRNIAAMRFSAFISTECEISATDRCRLLMTRAYGLKRSHLSIAFTNIKRALSVSDALMLIDIDGADASGGDAVAP